MFKILKKLKYGVRVLLSKGGGQQETIDLHGRPTVLRHAGQGTPFVYLHTTLGESAMWLPFFQTWAKTFRVLHSLKCDVFLGAHGGYYDMLAKYERAKKGSTTNPFVDPDGYRAYVDLKDKAFHDTLEAQRTKADKIR